MNKQEAIDEIKKQSTQAYDDFAIMRDTAIHIVNQIDEPQKPVVPKFVADFYESIKYDFESKVYELCLQYNRGIGKLSSEFREWFSWGLNEPIQTLVKMKLYGYEIEQERLYTVEISVVGSSRLFKHIRKNKYRFHSGKELEGYTDRLTEKEIKEADERLWQFAKPVEDK